MKKQYTGYIKSKIFEKHISYPSSWGGIIFYMSDIPLTKTDIKVTVTLECGK